MLLLLPRLDHLEAVLAVLELVLLLALVRPVLEQLGDLDVLVAVLAGSQVLALLGQVQVVEVLVEEGLADLVAILAAGGLLLFGLDRALLDLGQLAVDAAFEGHQDHRVELLELPHDSLLPKDGGQVGCDVVGPVLAGEVQLLLEEQVHQETSNGLFPPDLRLPKGHLFQDF